MADATPSGSIEAARNRFVELVGSGQGARGAGGDLHAVDVATFACLVCARPASWRIERPLGSYTVCDWCASVIQEYDAEHPELNPTWSAEDLRVSAGGDPVRIRRPVRP